MAHCIATLFVIIRLPLDSYVRHLIDICSVFCDTFLNYVLLVNFQKELRNARVYILQNG